jgi:NADH:ubiquinone oxidoreductase subunit E
MALPERLVREFDELVKRYPERRAALIPALHRCQEELGGWISPAVMEECAAGLLYTYPSPRDRG